MYQSHKNRELSFEDLLQSQKFFESLSETDRIMKGIDVVKIF